MAEIAEGAGAGAAGVGGLSGLLQNKLFLQYLAGAGGALSKGENVGGAIGNITQQNIASQNYAKMLQSMLGGMPTGAKLSGDRDNLSIKLPTSTLGDMGATGGMTGMNSGMGSTAPTAPIAPQGTTSNTNISQNNSMRSLLNPSPSPLGNMSPADLAGLTPGDISQAVGLYQEHQKFNLAEDKLNTKLSAASPGAPLEVPGIGKVSFEQWKSLDASTKAYSYYAFNAETRGEEVLSINEWKNQVDEPTQFELYNLGLKDPEFAKWLLKSKRAGATRISIGEKVETAEALQNVKNIGYFTDPKGISKDIEKYMASPNIEDQLIQIEPDAVDASGNNVLQKTKAKMAEEFIDDKIISAGGTITNKEIVNGAYVWTFKDKNGKIRKVNHAVKSN